MTTICRIRPRARRASLRRGSGSRVRSGIARLALLAVVLADCGGENTIRLVDLLPVATVVEEVRRHPLRAGDVGPQMWEGFYPPNLNGIWAATGLSRIRFGWFEPGGVVVRLHGRRADDLEAGSSLEVRLDDSEWQVSPLIEGPAGYGWWFPGSQPLAGLRVVEIRIRRPGEARVGTGVPSQALFLDKIEVDPIPCERPATLPIGRAEARPFLLGGFSVDEGDGVWAVGEASDILVPARGGEALGITVDLEPYVGPRGRTSAVRVAVGDRFEQEAGLGEGPQEIQFSIPPGILEPGPNRVSFRFVRERRPPTPGTTPKENRDLAAYLRAIRLDPPAPAGADCPLPSFPAVSPEPVVRIGGWCRSRFEQKAPSDVRFRFSAPEGASVSLEPTLVRRAGQGTRGVPVEVRLLDSRGQRLGGWTGEVGSSPQSIRIEVPPRAGPYVDLALLASAPADPWGAPSRIAWRGAAIERYPFEPPARPNVVVVLLDALRADALRLYGGRVRAPVIESLAEKGVRFHRAYSHAPYTLASIDALFTGTLPDPSWNNHRLSEEHTTLAERFAASGWRTILVTSNPHASEVFGNVQGFETVLDVGVQPVRNTSARDVTNRFLTECTRGVDPRPFFAFLHVLSPHSPYLTPATAPPFDSVPSGDERILVAREGKPPPTPAEISAWRRQYEDAVRYADAQLSRLLTTLRALGMDRSTIVAVVADHGEEFLDHGGIQHGGQLYDEMMRVPLILAGPGLPSGQVLLQPVGLMDLGPTLLDLAGAPRAGALPHAKSLVPLLGREGGGDGAVFLLDPDQGLAGVVSGPWKYIESLGRDGMGIGIGHVPGLRWLFRLDEDPGERVNRLATDADTATRLARETDRFLDLARGRWGRIPATIEPEMEERLRALGYVTGGAGAR